MFRTLLISMFLTSTALADTWTVDDDGKADFDNIQAAVDAASDGDEIVVMPGTYTGTGDQVVNMLGKAVWLHSSKGEEVTIIDGDGTRRGIFCASGETTETIIEGFTITNGYGGSGGGMYNNNSSPMLTDCVFDSNVANDGGGMFNSGSSPTLTNCAFNGNDVSHSGAGMDNSNSSPTLTGCTFTGNTAAVDGAGMVNAGSDPELTNCTFDNNIALYSGGVMYSGNSNPTLTDCTFTNNSANDEGGVMFSHNNCNTTLINCTFTGNTADQGGGMFNYGNSSHTLDGCTFTNNAATNYGGGIHNANDSDVTLTNTTVCGNTPDQIYGPWDDSGGNTIANVCLVDADGDGIDDTIDNCYLYNPDQADCNDNGIGDVCDIAEFTSLDCDQNSVPDECQPDCDNDGWIDPCDIEGDCDNDGVPDNCELDCNENNIPDDCDIIFGISQDCDENGIPDECDLANDPSLDCDENSVFDACEIAEDLSLDCNGNGVLDSCDILDQLPQGFIEWPIAEGGNGHFYAGIQSTGGWHEGQAEAESMGGHLATIGSAAENSFVFVNCASDIDLWKPGNGTTFGPWIGGLPVDGQWTWVDGTPWKYANWASGQPSGDGHTHFHTMSGGNPSDMWNDVSVDSQLNGYIVESAGNWLDCNDNGLLDTCEIEDHPSLDCDGDGVLDSCQEDDCDENGIPDSCDLQDPNNDQNNNGELDDCECIADITADGIVNIHDLLIAIGSWNSANPAADFNFDGTVNVEDLLILIAAWGPCE